MAELMDLMDRFIEEVFDWRVFCGIVAAIIVFIIEIRLTRNHKPANRRAEKAKKMGHVIKAKRVKAWDEDTTGYSVVPWHIWLSGGWKVIRIQIYEQGISAI